MGMNSEVIVEFVNVGKFVKVTAIDASTGKEVSIVGDPTASKKALTDLAVKKLRYVQNRDKK